jgi:hypothetical protein
VEKALRELGDLDAARGGVERVLRDVNGPASGRLCRSTGCRVLHVIRAAQGNHR